MGHLVNLARFQLVDFPILVANLVQDSPLDTGLVFLVFLPAATGCGPAVVFAALFRDFLETLFALFFLGFAVAQLVFLVAGALQQAPLHHVGQHLLESHLLFLGEPEGAPQLTADHRFVTEDGDNLFFAR